MGNDTITRGSNRNYPSSRIDGGTPYPDIASVVLRMERESGSRDSLPEFHNTDAIFGFEIRAHLQYRAFQNEDVENGQLNRILRIGLYDWTGVDRIGNRGFPPYPMRYAAVLGAQLLDRIRYLENRVSGAIPENFAN